MSLRGGFGVAGGFEGFKRLIARKYDGSHRRRPGRPVMAQIQTLVVRMATENRTWGHTRPQGALGNLHSGLLERETPAAGHADTGDL